MMNIKVILNNKEQIKEIKIDGHVNYDISGRDIVCASASTLLISSINHILSLDRESILYNDNGKVVTIKHNDNLKSVYSNVDGVLVSVGYKVHQGEIFAMSAKPKLKSDYESMLHFEVFYKESAIDPENMYTLSVSDFLLFSLQYLFFIGFFIVYVR